MADLLEEDFRLDDLILNPVGGFRRAFGRDVSGAEWVEAQQGDRRWLRLDLNRDGLYDRLPEGLFHQPTANDTKISKDEWVREMAVQQEREKAARLFFLPIEQEFFRQRVHIEQAERSYLPGSRSAFDSSDNDLVRFWNLPPSLTPVQVHRLLYLLPLFHRIAGDADYIAACFERVLEERVTLQLAPPELVSFRTETAPLGQWELGQSSLFDGLLADEAPVVRLTVHLSRADRVETYLPGGTGRRLIDWLGDRLFSLDTTPVVELDTSGLDTHFVLHEEPADTWLDLTTQL